MPNNIRNAGRKKLPPETKRKQIQIRLPPWLIEALDELPGNRTRNIEYAVKKTFLFDDD